MSKFANISTAVALAFGAYGTLGIAHAEHAADSKTRADVTAELAAAVAGGDLGAFTGEDSGSFHLSRQSQASALTRQQVIAEAIAARDGDVAVAMIGEDSGSWQLSQAYSPVTRSRAEVAQEVELARASGELGALVGEDGGSLQRSRPMPEHWARYVGPNIGNEFSLAPQQEQYFA